MEYLADIDINTVPSQIIMGRGIEIHFTGAKDKFHSAWKQTNHGYWHYYEVSTFDVYWFINNAKSIGFYGDTKIPYYELRKLWSL